MLCRRALAQKMAASKCRNVVSLLCFLSIFVISIEKAQKRECDSGELSSGIWRHRSYTLIYLFGNVSQNSVYGKIVCHSKRKNDIQRPIAGA